MLWRDRLTPPDMVLRAPFDALSGGSTSPNRTPQEARQGRAEGRAERALGTTAKSVRHSEGRSDRFRHQRHAAKLLGGKARVGLCRWSVVSKSAGVDMVASSYGDGQSDRVHYEGLQTCGSVWSCPCCGARISETRRDEMNRLLSWARSQGYRVMMLTLTARHGREDDLAELLERMKDAKQRWARHRAYSRIKPDMIGSVTATEVTGGGAHGWHPHFHVIVILDGDVDLTPLQDAWLASLRGAGLDGAGAAFQAQGADAAGNYIAKWGAAEELTLSQRKKGRGRTGRTPAQLLAASCDEGDRVAGHLWAEYATVFHGRRQLVWSRGLKALAGVGEVDDQEAAQDQQQDGQVETARANIPHQVWRDDVAARRADRRAELLDRAEEVGPDQAATELTAGHVPGELIEEDREQWQPRPGGLAERAMVTIRKPARSLPGSPDLDMDIEIVTQWGIYEENADRGGDAAVRPPGREASRRGEQAGADRVSRGEPSGGGRNPGDGRCSEAALRGGGSRQERRGAGHLLLPG